MSKNETSKTSFKPKEQIDNSFAKKILKLNKIIMEKDIEINSLQTKIIEFSKNIYDLKTENDKLKNLINIIEKELNNNKQIFPNNILHIQQTQRFIVFNESKNNNNSESFINLVDNDYFNISLNNSKKNITNYFNSEILPFKMKPYKIFDHRKLKVNYREFERDFLDEELLNEIKKNNTTIIDNITNYSLEHNINKNYSIEQIDNSNISNEGKSRNNNVEGIKLHSSMFFKNCKKIMNKNEYRNLIEIVKLSNSKQITKEETYLKITSLLDNKYPELSNEFKLLFI